MKSKKMKILMVGPKLNGKGGISSVVKTYFESGYFKHTTYIETNTDRNKIANAVRLIIAITKLVVLLFNKDYKIVHIHMASGISFIRKSIFVLISKLFGRKVIIHVHGGTFDNYVLNSNIIIREYLLHILNSANLIITLSNEWKSKLIKIGINKNKVCVLYNPVSILRIKKKTIRRKSVHILYLGKLCKQKGIYDLINVIKSQKKGDFKYLLAGDGDIEEVDRLINKYNLNEYVELLGWIKGKRKEQLLNSSDILVLPSYYEGLPISILEAMAYKLPVISTKVGGIPEIVEDGYNGYLIKPGDNKDLLEKMEKLILNKPLRKKMGLRGYSIVKSNYDIRIIALQLNKIYQKMGGLV